MSAQPPQDVRDLGLTNLTAPELSLANSLDARRPAHRALAWIALGVIVAVIATTTWWLVVR